MFLGDTKLEVERDGPHPQPLSRAGRGGRVDSVVPSPKAGVGGPLGPGEGSPLHQVRHICLGLLHAIRNADVAGEHLVARFFPDVLHFGAA